MLYPILWMEDWSHRGNLQSTSVWSKLRLMKAANRFTISFILSWELLFVAPNWHPYHQLPKLGVKNAFVLHGAPRQNVNPNVLGIKGSLASAEAALPKCIWLSQALESHHTMSCRTPALATWFHADFTLNLLVPLGCRLFAQRGKTWLAF